MNSRSAESVDRAGAQRRGLAVTLVLFLCVGCRIGVPGEGAIADAVLARPAVLAILDRIPLALEGSTVTQVEEYPGDRLYDYMNGAAVTYFEHGFRTLGACDVAEGSVRAKVELFRLDSAENAQRMYAEFAGSAGKALTVGTAGQYWHGFEPEGIFHRGPYFVRVLTYAREAETAVAFLAKVAGAVDRRICAQNGNSSPAGASD